MLQILITKTIWWFIPGIIILGLMTSYTDIKQGKIKNKHILFALIYALLTHLILIYLNWSILRTSYIIETGIMVIISLIVGFIIWYVGLWTAGDAKLYFVYSFLVPLSIYKYGYMLYFSTTNILINTFIPIFLYFFIFLMIKTTIKQKFYYLKKAFEIKRIIMLAFFIFALGFLIKMFFSFLNIQLDYFTTIFILFFLLFVLEKLLHLKMIQLAIVLSIVRLIFDKNIYTIDFWLLFVLTILIFIIVRFFIIDLGTILFTKEVDIKLLKEGMVPSESIYKEKEKYNKQSLITFTLIESLGRKIQKKDYVFEPTAEGLTKKDIEKLKKLELKLGFEHLKIHQTMPFAPFMFLGVITALIAQGNVIIRLMNLLF